MLTTDRKFLTDIEICSVCGHFLETRKIKGEWVCFDCIPIGEAKSYIPKIQKQSKITLCKQPKPESKPKKERLKREKKPPHESCQKILRKLFMDNPSKVFKSSEIVTLLGDNFDKRNITNFICVLSREGFIHTRKLNYGGINSCILCSRNPDLVEELIPEETAFQYRKYIFEHAPISTVKLASLFHRSYKSVGTLIQARLQNWVGVEKVGNKNYYYPLERKEEMLKLIRTK